MTVEQLIEALKKLPSKMPVVVENDYAAIMQYRAVSYPRTVRSNDGRTELVVLE